MNEKKQNLKSSKKEEKLIEKKICTKCEKEKNLSEFFKDKTKKDGYCYKCKDCYKAYNKERKQSKQGM